MFTHKHYVPVMKTKAGEKWALGRLTPPALQYITPVLEVHSHATKSTSDHLEETFEDIASFWPSGKLLFLDTIWIAGEPGDAGVITATFDAARNAGLSAIPVARLGFSAPSRQATRAAIQQDNRGCLIRLRHPETERTGDITALLASLGLTAAQADVMIDYQDAAMGDLASRVAAINAIGNWRTFSAASGVFPKSIISLPHNAWNQIARGDWLSWEQAIVSGTLARRPAFGDYLMRDPGQAPEYGEASVNLRYTKAHYWLAQIRDKVKDGASPQMHSLCADLLVHPEFDGAVFSAGDAEIAATAARTTNPGNAGQWNQWCMSHHLEFVAAQVRNHPAL